MGTNKPEAGQWWFPNTAKPGQSAQHQAVFAVGYDSDGNVVLQMADKGSFDAWSSLDGWHHDPRCTGWDWFVPADPTPPANQPDPDEWVVLDPVKYADHVPRIGIDQFEYAGRSGQWITQTEGHSDETVGQFFDSYKVYHRCRRRDLPPVEQCAACDAPAEPGTVGCKDCNEYATAICSPEPQPAKTRVRLWLEGPTKMIMCRDKAPYGDWQEIHHDAEGFYVIQANS